MEISKIIPHIEALIFAADRPLPATEILELLNNAIAFLEDRATPEAVEAAIEAVVEKYSSEFYAFEVKESGGGFQFLTKKAYYQTVAAINGEKFLKRLSTAALETLAIIAYRQPVSKGEIEYIRGVSSDYSLQKLLEKELIMIAGRSEDLPGKPLLYATSKAFMDYFGINSPKDLPKLKEVFDEEILSPTLINNDEERAALEEAAAGFLAVSERGELLEEVPGIPELSILEHQAKLEIDVSLLDKHNGESTSEAAETSEEETPAEGNENGLIEDISAAAPIAEEDTASEDELEAAEAADTEAEEEAFEAGESEEEEGELEAGKSEAAHEVVKTAAQEANDSGEEGFAANDEGEYDDSVAAAEEAEEGASEEEERASENDIADVEAAEKISGDDLDPDSDEEDDEDDDEGEYEGEDEDDEEDEEDDEDGDEDDEDESEENADTEDDDAD